MSEWATNPNTLHTLYRDADRLRIRHEAHARYSETPGRFFDWLLPLLGPLPGQVLLDVGCGHGAQHPRLRQQRLRMIGIDRSAGMASETRQQARDLALDVHVLRGDAQKLPLADASCDRAMANHVLFHVPDRLEALREIRRVVRPGGRIVLATYAADSGKRLFDLHHQMAQQLGYEPQPAAFERFHLGDLPLVRQVFATAQLKIRRDAFLFPDVASALLYYGAQLIDRIASRPADGSHRVRLLQLMTPEIQKIIDREGVFRIPKDAGCFVAEV